MTTARARKPQVARVAAGLAATALLTAGLACQGTAIAADPAGYPHTFDFQPSDLVATADAVYTAGVTDDGAAYVAEVGGTETALGTGIYSVQIALDPSDDTLRALTQDETGQHLWSIDTADLDATELTAPTDNTDLLGTDADGVFSLARVGDDETLTLDASGLAGPVAVSTHASASAAVAQGADGARTWTVGGSQFVGESSVATVWTYDEAADEVSAPVALGAEGSPDESVLDVAADQSTGVVYATSFRNNVDGPQTYGLSIVDHGAETYVPTGDLLGALALSPDGRTLYVADGGSVFAVDTAHAADFDSSDVNLRSASQESGWIRTLTLDPGGQLFLSAGNDVVAFGRPGSVSGFHTETWPDAPGYVTLTWQAPTTTGGANAYDLRYVVTVIDRAGGEPTSQTTFDPSVDLTDLVAGHTYDVRVAADNGLFLAEPMTTSFTVAAPVAGPSSVAVRGTARVGSTVSVASTGAWAKGAALSYRWTANGKQVATSPTLALTASLVGKRLQVAVTGTLAGYAPRTVTSAPSAAVAKGVLTAAKPTVSGTAKVGKTLTANAGRWTAGTKLTYSWSANGKAIKGATKRTLAVTKALKGKRITVTVTGSLSGYSTAARTSEQTRKV